MTEESCEEEKSNIHLITQHAGGTIANVAKTLLTYADPPRTGFQSAPNQTKLLFKSSGSLCRKWDIMSTPQASSLPSPSALTNFVAASPPQPPQQTYHQSLALQVLHNLRHQHYWTSLRLHTHSPITNRHLPRPLISGLPPTRIYIHPDDQIEELKAGVKEEDVGVEREWVLPTRLREKWSLKRFGEVFDGVGEEPEGGEEACHGDEEGGEKKVRSGKRRGGKRVLLATVGDDSTVVYYIIHDGIVKPRQN
ncbi:MAG: hypothetical protein Q9217_003818 [Psora testacea]